MCIIIPLLLKNRIQLSFFNISIIPIKELINRNFILFSQLINIYKKILF